MASLLEDAPLPITSDQAAQVLKDFYGLTGDVVPLVGDRDRNFAVRSDQGQWMLKVANPAERFGVLETQQLLLRHLQRWDPQLSVPVPVAAEDGSLVVTATISGHVVPVRLTTFLPGASVDAIGWNQSLRLDAATVLARLDLALRSFVPGEIGAPDEWQIDRLNELRPHTAHLNRERRRIAEAWLDYCDDQVVGRLEALRRQTIHGDFNPSNLIVDPTYPERLAGVIDFGDMTVAPLVADPAIAAAYLCLDTEDPAGAIAAIAGDYHRQSPLLSDEIEVFGALAVSRLVQSLIISSWRAALHPENRDYILVHAEPIWAALQRLESEHPEILLERVAANCHPREAGARTTDEALQARRSHMSPGMRLSYDRPLRIRSGHGVWLTDADGVRYLDAYNNVAHVGHSHPAVVAALSTQAGRLNTNTRYLVDEVTDYAERLASLLPEPLDTVFFANSGSEANDLAWRIARTVTGRRGMIVTRHAYHGSTDLTINTSPEELGIENLPPWVATVPAPTGTEATAEYVAVASQSLAAAGELLAAFACDTVFSSDGIYEPPPDYLESAYRFVRAHGGLCIADEVQAGFGRVGSRFWGFASGPAVPDIVTLGKPMGNGHPIAAVVTSAAIAAEFSQTGYYFSTFAGNPVSAAVGETVLDLIERHNLPEQADEVGEYLRKQLGQILTRYTVNAIVRGPGLFIGVEVLDRDNQPDPRVAHLVQNRMREERVLIGRTGYHNNVLKIRPPLVFAEAHADVLLEAMDGVLRTI